MPRTVTCSHRISEHRVCRDVVQLHVATTIICVYSPERLLQVVVYVLRYDCRLQVISHPPRTAES